MDGERDDVDMQFSMEYVTNENRTELDGYIDVLSYRNWQSPDWWMANEMMSVYSLVRNGIIEMKLELDLYIDVVSYRNWQSSDW